MCVSENFAYEDHEQALDSVRRCAFAVLACVNDGGHPVSHSSAVDHEGVRRCDPARRTRGGLAPVAGEPDIRQFMPRELNA